MYQLHVSGIFLKFGFYCNFRCFFSLCYIRGVTINAVMNIFISPEAAKRKRILTLKNTKKY